MVRFLKALILLPISILVILLAVANRAPVRLSLDPFSEQAPEFSFEAPLYALIFGAVALGVLIGGTAAWLNQRKNRKERRLFRREAQHLRTEAERLRARQASAGPALPAPSSSYL